MVKRNEPPPAIFLFFAYGVLLKSQWAYDVMRARTYLQNVGKMKKMRTVATFWAGRYV